jgi:hypothetical protein
LKIEKPKTHRVATVGFFMGTALYAHTQWSVANMIDIEDIAAWQPGSRPDGVVNSADNVPMKAIAHSTQIKGFR